VVKNAKIGCARLKKGSSKNQKRKERERWGGSKKDQTVAMPTKRKNCGRTGEKRQVIVGERENLLNRGLRKRLGPGTWGMEIFSYCSQKGSRVTGALREKKRVYLRGGPDFGGGGGGHGRGRGGAVPLYAD